MLALFWILMQLPPGGNGGEPAWTARTPGVREAGVYATAVVVDLIGVDARGYVKLGGLDPLDGCRLDALRPEGVLRDFSLPGDGFIGLNGGAGDKALPVLMFAKAHNLPVQVLLIGSNPCRIYAVRTCSDPQTCATPMPRVL